MNEKNVSTTLDNTAHDIQETRDDNGGDECGFIAFFLSKKRCQIFKKKSTNRGGNMTTKLPLMSITVTISAWMWGRPVWPRLLRP